MVVAGTVNSLDGVVRILGVMTSDELVVVVGTEVDGYNP